jgi:exonuclease SbcC
LRNGKNNYDEAQLNTEKDALLQTNVDAVRRLEEVNNSLEKAKSNLQSLENQHAFLLNEYQEIDKHILTIQQNIEQNLIQTSFKDITSIQTCLQQNINITQASNTIQAHETESQVLEQQLAQFDDSIATLTIDIAEIDRLKNNIKESKITLSKTEQMRAVQVNKKEQLLEQIAIKEAISKQIAVITNRSQNLQVLKNLFNGAGFVNYISTIYLKKLCDLANKRFHRLTKNQLSLSINELNDFEIIDYLNNGYSRSVKTLSGGQLFQASLCLALALAENVKSMFTSSKNFFFIDEGFGTLDADSLEIVIETLQNLKKENRIVGVISHVEALKESMPQYITIEKDLQLGSIIQYE